VDRRERQGQGVVRRVHGETTNPDDSRTFHFASSDLLKAGHTCADLVDTDAALIADVGKGRRRTGQQRHQSVVLDGSYR